MGDYQYGNLICPYRISQWCGHTPREPRYVDSQIRKKKKTIKILIMAYYDNKEHKKIIDCVLEQNAKLFQNLGSDCSKSDYEKAKVAERQKLRKIIHLDEEKIGRLIKDSLDD